MVRAAIALVAPLAFYKFCPEMGDARVHAIATAIIGASGTMLGFLITAVSIIAALMDRPLISNLRKTGHFDRLMHDTFITCASLLFALTAGLTSLFLDGDGLRYVAMVLFFSMLLGVLYLLEAGKRFRNIITNL